MTRYQGRRSDVIRAQHRFVKEHGTGAEDRNFLPRDGYCYGYAPMHQRLDLKARFRTTGPNGDYVDGIDIVFIARRPGGGVFVVGWYENARLYATLQKSYSRPWLAEAAAANCTLLEPQDRILAIPIEANSGPRSPAVWYGTRQDALKRRVRQLMSGDYKPNPGRVRRAPTGNVDVLRKSEIEKSAVATVERFYTRRGFDILDVQSENCGWDLEAKLHTTVYRLEVKGSAHDRLTPELTPNEYHASQLHSFTYRVCIVTRALSRSPELTEVFFDPDTSKWVQTNGIGWSFHERTAAKLVPS